MRSVDSGSDKTGRGDQLEGQRFRGDGHGCAACSSKNRRVTSSHFCVSSPACSSHLLEANLVGLLAEASPADHELVLSDKTFLVSAATAGAGVLSVLSGVRVLQVGHILFRPFIY